MTKRTLTRLLCTIAVVATASFGVGAHSVQAEPPAKTITVDESEGPDAVAQAKKAFQDDPEVTELRITGMDRHDPVPQAPNRALEPVADGLVVWSLLWLAGGAILLTKRKLTTD